MTDRYQALRDAIAAGPTPGRRVVRGRIYKHGETVRVETEAGYQIADVIDAPDGDAAQNAANLALIREADPDTIRALLGERDALREALQGLLNALPSATTHPAIRAARAALAMGGDDV